MSYLARAWWAGSAAGKAPFPRSIAGPGGADRGDTRVAGGTSPGGGMEEEDRKVSRTPMFSHVDTVPYEDWTTAN